MKISREMVVELNHELANKGCPFRFKFTSNYGNSNPQMEITLPSLKYIDSFIINPNNEFYDWLELWFKIKGIELSYNNTRSIIWSKSGWDKD